MKVKWEFITAPAFRCSQCRMTEREDTREEIRLVQLDIITGPMASAGAIFTLCPDHLREFIQAVNHAGIGALGQIRSEAAINEFNPDNPQGLG